MKKINSKKILAIFMCALLSFNCLVGCGSKKDSNTMKAKETYGEKMICEIANQNFIGIDAKDNLYRLDVKDGLFKKKDDKWENVPCEAITPDKAIVSAAMNKNGEWVLIYYEDDGNNALSDDIMGSGDIEEEPEIEYHMLLIDKNAATVSDNVLKESSYIQKTMWYGEDKVVIAKDSSTISIYSKDGQNIKDIDIKDESYDFAIFKNKIACIGEGISEYDLETGNEINLDKAFINKFKKLVGKDNYDLSIASVKNSLYFYIKNNKTHSVGVYKSKDGKDISTLFDADKMASIDNYIDKMFIDSKERVYIIVNLDESYAIYEYDKTNKKTNKNTINIYSLYDNFELNEIIKKYNNSQDKIYVKLYQGIGGNSSVTPNDAIKKFNTELLEEDKYDIICLDNLPIENYLKDIELDNLKSLINDNLISNVALYKDRVINLGFNVTCVYGHKKNVEAVKSLKTLRDNILVDKKSKALGFWHPVVYFNAFYPVIKEDILTKKGLNKKKLKEDLVAIKKMSDIDKKYYKKHGQEDTGKVKVDDYLQNGKYSLISTFEDYGIMGNFNDMNGQIYCSNLNNYFSINYLNTLLDDNDIFKTNSLFKKYVPVFSMAVISKSKNTKKAKEFIKYCLSDEPQEKSGSYCLPVNKNAFKNMLKPPKKEEGEEESIIDYAFGNKKHQKQMKYPDDETINIMFEQFSSLKGPFYYTPKEFMAIQKSIALYLIDKKSLKDTIKEIEQKFDILIKER